MIQALAFYLFAAIAIASAVMVVTARNPVHSVLFLVLVFFNAAALFVLMGAEFLAMLLVVVYVGAVGVLFLFVVMMLDVDATELRRGFIRYLPIGAAVGIVMFIELVFVFAGWSVAGGTVATPTPSPETVDNTRALGQVLYTKYVFFFQASGLVLLIAMVGAIVLTLRERVGVRKQDVARQTARTRAEAVEVVKVSSGSGV